MRFSPGCLATLSVLLVLTTFPFSSTASPAFESRTKELIAPGQIWSSSGSKTSAKAAADSFYLYGGPGNVHSYVDPGWDGTHKNEGQFQSATGAPELQGWTGFDATQSIPHWRASTTNAAHFDPASPDNHAVISNHAELYRGYGNLWDDRLTLRLDLTQLGLDPIVDTVNLRLTCRYSHFTEPWYDFLNLEVGRGSTWDRILQLDGATTDSTGAYVAIDFDSDDLGGIQLSPADYMNGELQLRFRVTSDGSYSDEDGNFSSGGLGAAALDDIQVYVNGNLVSTATWEPYSGIPADQPDGVVADHDNGAALGTDGWLTSAGPGYGDFSKLTVGFQDLDPCRTNISGQIGFIDDGTPPNNAPGQSTGGSVSSSWSYGVPGGWVVNYTGGVSGGIYHLSNHVTSPEIAWDLPGSEDDSAYGVLLRATLYEHLPFYDGYNMIWLWQIRSYTAQDGWGLWRSKGFVYLGDSRRYEEVAYDVSSIVESDAEKIQVRFGVEDWEFYAVSQGLPPTSNATPSPLFDNIRVAKYDLRGPYLEVKDSVADGFPVTGELAGPVRFDTVNDFDAVGARIQSLTPGVGLADPTTGGHLRVAHLANPIFAAERAAGLAEVGATQTGSDDRGWPIYEYAVPGEVDGSDPEFFYFDLPDGPARSDIPEDTDETALIFSGDRLHFYLECTDTQGGVSRLPEDTTGFLDFGSASPYLPRAGLRALPSWDGNATPTVLLWDETRFGNGETAYVRAMAELGSVEGRDYDLCTRNPRRMPSLLQIEAYDTILCIDPGSEWPPSSLEIALFSDWHHQLKDRFHAYLGSQLLHKISGVSNGPGFLSQILGLDVFARDVSQELGEKHVPLVTPAPAASGAFASSFAVGQLCPDARELEWIDTVVPGAQAAHLFSDDDGLPLQPPVAASILWNRVENGFQKTTIAFPFDLTDVSQDRAGGPSALTARARLLGEILALSGMPPGAPITDAEELPKRFTALPNHPNPFNPHTSIRYYAPVSGKVTLKIFDVRGAEVHESQRQVQPGWGEFTWTGRDDEGRPVASGVYYYRVSGFGERSQGKMALLK